MLAKLDVYRKFTNALAIAVIVSVGWICYEVMLAAYFLRLSAHHFVYFLLEITDEYQVLMSAPKVLVHLNLFL